MLVQDWGEESYSLDLRIKKLYNFFLNMEKFTQKHPEIVIGKEREQKAIIVSGFTGIGKTNFFNNYTKLSLLDLDSVNFSRSEENSTLRHTDWPQNYIDHIKKSRENVDIIFISTHKEIRDWLVEANIEFVLIYPSLEMKDEYIRRYIERGSNDDFVKRLEENYEGWINELMGQESCSHIVLQPGQYLSDVVEIIVTES